MAEVKWLQAHSCARRFYRFLFALVRGRFVHGKNEAGTQGFPPDPTRSLRSLQEPLKECLHTTVACIK